MLPLQLTFAGTQLAVALGSATLLFLLRQKPQKNALPIFVDEPLNGSHGRDQTLTDDHEELAGAEKADPFDIVKPIDFLDGFPIQDDEFWGWMKLQKSFQTGLIGVLLCLDAMAIGWIIAAGGPKGPAKFDIITAVLQALFSIYICILSFASISQITIDEHWSSTLHMSTLTTTAAALYSTRLILPTTVRETSVESGYEFLSLLIYLTLAYLTLTTPRCAPVHFPAERVYSRKMLESSAPTVFNNVCGIVNASVWSILLFSYSTPVVMQGYTATSIDIKDLPLVPGNMRAPAIFAEMRAAYKNIKFKGRWKPKAGSGWGLLWKLMVVNKAGLMMVTGIVFVSAASYYLPAYYMQKLIRFLEVRDDERSGGTISGDRSWGWVYCIALFCSNAFNYLIGGQLWSVATTTLQVRFRVQMNTILFAKTLVRKDIASSSPPSSSSTTPAPASSAASTLALPITPTPATPDSAPTTLPVEADVGSTKGDDTKTAGSSDEEDFSSKAQIMTLMTTDVDRVADFSYHYFSLIDAPIEIVIGSIFLYSLLGVSAFIGLAVTALFLPINHFASKIVVKAQDDLMKTRDERVSLMNEILGGIRMLKFMAWERSFEKRVLKIRERELQFQKKNYYIEALFNAVWQASPVMVTLVAFWHFTVVRGEALTPSIAFTSLSVFNELKYALNALPETFISFLQSLVSLRRIEKYLESQEVASVPPLHEQTDVEIILNSATITWPQNSRTSGSSASSVASTPKYKFLMQDLTLHFPRGELSLICGKLGSGKTLLLLALLGEADLLAGQIISPRSPPDCLANFSELTFIPDDEWIVRGVCAYVPQTAWLQNASIRENILFNLPYNEKRYTATLEACALVTDFQILEDGDEAEIGERGVNLSGGQKARVSLARAIYSRAEVLLLDDVLSAVDAHTAHHLYQNALRGPLVKGRTVILVSHHVQLVTPGAGYIVAFNNGKLLFEGDRQGFKSSGVFAGLVQSTETALKEDTEKTEPIVEAELVVPGKSERDTNASEASTIVPASLDDSTKAVEKKKPRKLIDDEQRAVGRVSRRIWELYARAAGGAFYWTVFPLVLAIATLGPVFENGWLRYWSGLYDGDGTTTIRDPLFYIGVYAALTTGGLVFQTVRWIVLYEGSIHASTILYKRLLKSVLFAHIRFHDTTNRGRLLNRFGKDFEGIDSSLSDNLGRTVMYALSALTTFVTITWVGGVGFLVAVLVFAVLYYQVAKVYGQISRDLRRLDSVTRSPLYTIYGESIAGVGVLRAFGATTKFMREMQQHVDTNTNPYYWMWSVNRWLSVRFNLLSSGVVGLTAVVVLLNTSINASLAGFALTFASTVTGDLMFMVRRFVGLEQSMVAVERVQEFIDLPQEPAEFIEPRPPANWPHEGSIEVENLVIRYAPQLPNVLHGLTFSVQPRSKIGVLGRTGGGKSTLALSFFRFVEATEGRILVDGVDISNVGLTDLRSRLTIIPQDPTILSGTLRSTLDVFDEYSDHEIFEALRRVHLIPSEDEPPPTEFGNTNVFRNLDSPVSEGGENFSSGEKQLICMARAILKRSKVLLMDEATASVDYATDELISKTIRQEFSESTILTIAHRLRTVIDYDKILLLDQGKIAEYDEPSALLANPNSKFFALCKSAGADEFATLKRMADEAAESRLAPRI